MGRVRECVARRYLFHGKYFMQQVDHDSNIALAFGRPRSNFLPQDFLQLFPLFRRFFLDHFLLRHLPQSRLLSFGNFIFVGLLSYVQFLSQMGIQIHVGGVDGLGYYVCARVHGE